MDENVRWLVDLLTEVIRGNDQWKSDYRKSTGKDPFKETSGGKGKNAFGKRT